MLHIWMEQNVLFYGMIGAGILGILCMFMVDRFYGRAIRDVRRITEPKGKWTKEFLNQRQIRKALNRLRSKYLAAGRYSDGIDKVILQVAKPNTTRHMFW